MRDTADRPNIPRGTIATLLSFVGVSIVLGWVVGSDLPELHTILDTAMFVLSGVLALLLWDMGRRLDRPFLKHLSITFASVALLEALHASVSVEWSGPMAAIARMSADLRPLTWPPPAALLPVGVGLALVLLQRRVRTIVGFAVLQAIAALGLFLLFQGVAPYAEAGVLGITRPSLIPAPLLWALIAWACWRLRDRERAIPSLGLMGLTILISSAVMLYSRFPADTMAIIAHLGRVAGYLALLFSLMHMAALDMAERVRAEARLARLNEELDARVREQTAQLRASNGQLAAEIAERRKSYELLDAITEHSPAILYVKDLDGRYLLVNRRYCEAFHLDRAAVLGKTDYDIFAKEAADAFRAMDQRVARAEAVLTEEETEPQADGAHTYISVKAPLLDESGSPYATFAISTDVTDLKRAEERLAESEERARLIIETALDAVIGMDKEGRVADWSPQAAPMFGWTREEALGRPLADLIIPERYRDSHRAGLARYLARGEARVLNQRIEIAALHRDGREFPVELSITPIRTGAGVSFSAFVRDITERKIAEGKLRAQLERMALLDQITRAIGERQDIDSIFQVAVRSLEDQLPVDFVCLCLYDRPNKALTVARIGAKSEALAVSLAMPERAHIEIDENGLSRCVRGALVYEPDIKSSRFPFPQRLAKGGLHAFVAAPLQVESQVFGALIVARHEANSFSSGECEFLRQLSQHVALASHQAQLYSALSEAYNELRHTQDAVMQQERLRSLGQMASGIAHDINNALSPIALYTESLLASEPGLSPAGRGKLEVIDRAIDDAAHTVSRMKDFYRQREPELKLAPVEMSALIQHAIDLTKARWRDMAEERGVSIEVKTELAPGAPPVWGVESELREALINLVLNAIDAMPAGGAITLRTRHAAGRGAGKVQIEVTDTGAGMDEATRTRCLEPFFTTKGERGTGLGLAMVYGAVRRHGGDIEIESALGQGTTVRLILDAAPADSAGARAQPAELARPAERLKLLIIDDDPILLRSLRDVLEGDGHLVAAANDGPAGVAAFTSALGTAKAFDVVITDLGMPKLDGRRVAAAVKAASPKTPVLLLTGWGERLMAEEALPANIDHVLSKPPKLREVRAALAASTGAAPQSKSA
ncbi:PAS domain S-box protein [Vitreimonas sp.]|uniref:PAS domain S-box protein n=1 Tax=Vitreimonas sp. TaxID=3069702 RepID=UPI002D78B0EA|nr:PAS domain S-box protein [Vitreimonas sp.]